MSWVLSYVSIEYSIRHFGKQKEFGILERIKDAMEKLRSAEENSLSPTDERSPITYLKTMCPQYSCLFECLESFMDKITNNTAIRKNYNYIKHRGKPFYTEQQSEEDCKVLGVYKNNIEQATDSRDVAYKISLEASVKELKEFDDQMLFPYIKELISITERIVSPSGLTQ